MDKEFDDEEAFLTDIDDFGLEDLVEESDTIDAEMALVFVDDALEPVDFADCEKMANDVLGLYTFEEIMDMNELSDTEALALLFERGDIGLPSEITDEEVQDLPQEEVED